MNTIYIMNERRGRGGRNKRTITYDSIDKAIIIELVKDANIKNIDLSKRLKIPLSTLQRRTRQLLQSSPTSVLKKRFHIDTRQLGLRRGDIIIGVTKGKTKQVLEKVLQSYRDTNILSISTRVNDRHNIVVDIVYNDSDELFKILESINSLPNVTHAEWSELVEDMENTNSIESIVGKL